jgi:hypothetical protein
MFVRSEAQLKRRSSNSGLLLFWGRNLPPILGLGWPVNYRQKDPKNCDLSNNVQQFSGESVAHTDVDPVDGSPLA